jgi:hypothetical protein
LWLVPGKEEVGGRLVVQRDNDRAISVHKGPRPILPQLTSLEDQFTIERLLHASQLASAFYCTAPENRLIQVTSLTNDRIFEIAIIVFNLVQRSNNMALAAAGQPNMDPAGAIADVVFFIPGVTASLVAFLVFGTTKSWRQYWGLFTGVCGIRSKIVQKRAARRVASPEQSLEFQRLPSLTRNLAEEERARTAEAEDRVRIYSQLPESTGVGELVRSTTLKGPKKSVVHVKEQEVSSGGPAGTRNFYRPFPSTFSNTYGSPGSAEIDIHISSNDLVVQRGNERFDEELGNEMQQGIMVERQYYVESSYEVPPSMLPKRIDFREDASV